MLSNGSEEINTFYIYEKKYINQYIHSYLTLKQYLFD